MRSTVESGTSGMQRFTIDGEPYVGVGVNLGQGDASYFESFSLETADRTLRAIWATLAIGTIATTALATFFGWSTSGRLLRPLSRVADAAGEIAEGGLDTRMEPETDRDLDRLVGAFNNMADAVQERIEREARFASDVSHELRSPITALSAAIEVVHGRREELPERTQQALDVVVNQVRRFDDMVIDLLELSRLDAGATDLNLEAGRPLRPHRPHRHSARVRRCADRRRRPGDDRASRPTRCATSGSSATCCSTPTTTPAGRLASASNPPARPGSC